MAASDHLNQQQFYHGSRHQFASDEMIEPGHGPGYNPGDLDNSYFSTSPDFAAGIARGRGDLSKPLWVHQVKPTGPYEPDANDFPDSGNFQSRHPLHIVNSYQMDEGTTGTGKRRRGINPRTAPWADSHAE